MTTPIPSWALEIARPLVTSGIGVATAIERIALALVEADAAGEKRGRAMGLEEAAKVADNSELIHRGVAQHETSKEAWNIRMNRAEEATWLSAVIRAIKLKEPTT